MARKTRIKYTKEIKSKIWDRYQQGKSLKSIARFLETQSSSIYIFPSLHVRFVSHSKARFQRRATDEMNALKQQFAELRSPKP
ncbi:hypothetical protein GCM10007941_14670 [Amphritea balenae]|nr:hypothetical protein GCM10007941_14670 [Amphritea balenae]